MSFTTIVKNEVSKLETTEEEKLSELSAFLSNSAVISNTIKIQTENASIARMIFSIIKDTYKINPLITVRKGYNYTKSYIYILEVKTQVNEILESLGLNNSAVPKEFIYDDDNLIKAYLSGLFIACGSINDPKTSRYHLEFFVDTYEYSEFVLQLLNSFDLNSKSLKRDNKYMIYIKESEKIGDFLRIINAVNALLYYEDIRIYRDHKNMTNRLNNCEQANVDKIIETSNKQTEDINLINKLVGLEILSENVQIAATYRIKYPDASLQELSEIITMETGKPITKPGLHHRFNKIKELAQRLRNKEGD